MFIAILTHVHNIANYKSEDAYFYYNKMSFKAKLPQLLLNKVCTCVYCDF